MPSPNPSYLKKIIYEPYKDINRIYQTQKTKKNKTLSP